MSTYEALTAVHVLSAITWVGGAFMIQLFVVRAQSSGQPERLAAMSKDVEFLGQRTFIPASLLLVITGFLLIAEGDWEFKLWIVFALGVFAASFVTGAAFLGPESGRIGALIESQGAAAAAVQERLKRVFLISRIELVFLVLVVIDMVVKPGA